MRPPPQGIEYEHEQQLSEKLSTFTQENMSALRDLANVALAQYTKIYDEVIAEQEITGAPSGDKLFNWMKAKLYEYEDQDVEEPVKTSVPVEAKSLPREDDEVPVIEEKTETKTPAKKTKTKQPVAATTEGKLSSKVIKSKPIVYKTKNEAGEETEKSVDLPYLPCCVDYTGTCQALKVNGGLFTPCLTRPAKNSEFCKICEKQGFKYGKIEDRNGMPVSCYVDPNEKKEISFGTYLQKRDIPREAVEQLIKEAFGDEIQIPEHYWNVDKAKGKRAVKKTKSVSASSDEVSSVEEGASVAESVETTDKPTTEKKEQKQRGRPKKQQKSDETAAEETEKPKGKRGRPKKVQKEVEDVVETETTESSEGWMNGLVEEEESSEKVPEPVKKQEEKVVAPPPAPVEEENEVEELEGDDDDEDEDGITYFSYNGKKYGYDEENTLFVVDEDGDVEIVGTWDPETKKPVFSED